MKVSLLVTLVLVLVTSAVAQTVCREAKSEIIEHKLGYTFEKLTLPSQHVVPAEAVIPDKANPADAIVFSFSTLVSSDPKESVDMLPIAMQLAERGRAVIVVERTLTWPEIDKSVGTMEGDVICAQQWLSRHAAVRDDWKFVGPTADSPHPETFRALNDYASMRFWVTYPIGDENINTENMLSDKGRAHLVKGFLTLFLDECQDLSCEESWNDR
jgi:hypothetical protein